jgi:hypothetical protein
MLMYGSVVSLGIGAVLAVAVVGSHAARRT